MKINHTIRGHQVTEGTRLADDHIVFSVSPSLTQPGFITIAAGLDSHVYVRVISPTDTIEIIGLDDRTCRCGHASRQHELRTNYFGCVNADCDCTDFVAAQVTS